MGQQQSAPPSAGPTSPVQQAGFTHQRSERRSRRSPSSSARQRHDSPSQASRRSQHSNNSNSSLSTQEEEDEDERVQTRRRTSEERPPLDRNPSSSTSSTHTITSLNRPHRQSSRLTGLSSGSSASGQSRVKALTQDGRRKSIALPDLDPALLGPSASSLSPTGESASRRIQNAFYQRGNAGPASMGQTLSAPAGALDDESDLQTSSEPGPSRWRRSLSQKRSSGSGTRERTASAASAASSNIIGTQHQNSPNSSSPSHLPEPRPGSSQSGFRSPSDSSLSVSQQQQGTSPTNRAGPGIEFAKSTASTQTSFVHHNDHELGAAASSTSSLLPPPLGYTYDRYIDGQSRPSTESDDASAPSQAASSSENGRDSLETGMTSQPLSRDPSSGNAVLSPMSGTPKAIASAYDESNEESQPVDLEHFSPPQVSAEIDSNQLNAFNMTQLPPLQVPQDTIVAPLFPANVALPPPIALPLVGSAFAKDGSGKPANEQGDRPLDASPKTRSRVNSANAGEALAQHQTLDQLTGLAGLDQNAMVNAISPEESTLVSPIPILPPNVMTAAAPIAALTNLANPAAAEAVKNATVDLGAGPEGVPTLLTWRPGNRIGGEGGPDGTGEGASKKGPERVYVTGTFANRWQTKIELSKKSNATDFSALISLPPGPHRLKFIVDKQWKTSKNLPSATDQDGNLINYLQVHPSGQRGIPRVVTAPTDDSEEEEDPEEHIWCSDIPPELIAYGEASDAAEDAIEQYLSSQQGEPTDETPEQARERINKRYLPSLVQPPALPAQLERGVLNSTALVPQGSGDDPMILPKPDHSVIDHLAASPIKQGLLCVGITKRYKRKYVTTVFYKPIQAMLPAQP
ncbi:hypothetical protein E5Q_02792 [Mixia osmundae IAM 14324]|uniref:Association with the SNF1 complex (ASC) domain-containing protein n=1 Tax=Mixia osmundae (strain CBS 9802 / IAM 14324 / JCM 22182 / KY 12970) TaxID=764103 RepID=G7DZX1_MIXOS|nr:hypothetical protein E5Q_02792 [Mixia osmundae IAM 14324]